MNQKKMQIQNKAITISTKSFSNQVKLRSGRKLHKYIFLNFKPVLIKHIWLPGQQFSPFSICGVSFLKFSYSDSLNHFPSLISPFRPPVSANRSKQAARRGSGGRVTVPVMDLRHFLHGLQPRGSIPRLALPQEQPHSTLVILDINCTKGVFAKRKKKKTT